MGAPTAKEVAGHGAFVFIAYFLAFGIWTAASGNDFISSKWRSIRKTRRRGKVHVYLICVPMVYMSAYIAFQVRSGDNKEGATASLALAFALLHLVRTFVGLWQLHIFKQWAIASVKSMESLGFDTRETPFARAPGVFDADDEDIASKEDSVDVNEHQIDASERISYDRSIHDLSNSEDLESSQFSSGYESGSTDENSHNEDPHENDQVEDAAVSRPRDFSPRWFTRSSSEPQESRIERFVDEMLVNETLIDNRLSEVPTTCYLQWFSKFERKNLCRQKSSVRRLLFCMKYSLLNTFRLGRILLSLTFWKNPRLPNSETSPRIISRYPETVWLRWATALVAQAGWMKTLDSAIFPTDPKPSAEYGDHRNSFAEQILMSAALHSRSAEDAMKTSPDCGDEGGIRHGFLAPHTWRKYPQLRKGKFSKQEFLRYACRTGNGLPYMAPHPEAVGTNQEMLRCGYSNFESELQRAREALPAAIEAHVRDFTVEKLEWFTIFLSVPDWALNAGTKKKKEIQKPDSTSELNAVDTEIDLENDIPIDNLRKQLGFSKMSNFSIRRLRFPLLRNISKKTLWGNRNILEVSCRIDNWMALCSGEHTSYMVKHVPWMDQKCLVAPMSNDSSEKNRCIVDENIDLERCKFLCQMAILEPEDAHFEKSLTFLGCSMEMLRSSLAKWAENASNQDESDWKPVLCTTPRNASDPISVTEDLTSLLCNIDCVSQLTERYIQMRVLWEVQNQLHMNLPKDGVAPSSTKAMILCVLSFPALSMDVREAPRDDGRSRIREKREECIINLYMNEECKFEIGEYEYAIRASCGPQDAYVIVSFEKDAESRISFSVRLGCDEECGTNVFKWQAWRDCFYGRLEGARQWQENLGIAYVPLLPTAEKMWTGVEKTHERIASTGSAMNLWKGWMPPRPSICMYEIATPDFVTEAVKTKDVLVEIDLSSSVWDRFSVPQEIWMPVTYEDAKPLSLKNASLVAQHFLEVEAERTDAPVIGLQDPMERAENLLKEEMDDDGSLALLMLELAATETGNTSALQRAVSILLGKGSSNYIVRSLTLLERFYFSKTPNSETATLYRFFRDEERIKVVQSLFEKLLIKSEYDHVVAGRYFRFLLALSKYTKNNLRERARTTVFKSLVLGGHLRQTTKAAFAISDFSRTLGIEIPEDFAVQHLACINLVKESSIARKENIPGYNMRRWKAVKGLTMSDLGACIRALSKKEEGETILGNLGLTLQSALELREKAVAEEYYEYALVELGYLFLEGGKGIEKNAPRALTYYQKAADLGFECGYRALANLLSKGAEGVDKNVSRALELYLQAIDETGSEIAMIELARTLVKEGSESKMDALKAVRIFECAIPEGQTPYPMLALAQMLEISEYGMQDIPRAICLYQKAIEDHGSADARMNLASLLRRKAHGAKDVPRAMRLYEQAIDENQHQYAMEQLALVLEDDEHGVKDISRAINLHQRGVEQHQSLFSMERLGKLLEEDEHGVQDISRSVNLHQRAVKQHESLFSMELLGDILRADEHGVQDISLAINLHQRAVKQHQNEFSMASLAYILEREEHGVQDISRAINMHQRAVEQHQTLVSSLGYILEREEHGEQDISRSVNMHQRAVQQYESEFSMERLGKIMEGDEHGVQDISRAINLYQRAVKQHRSQVSIERLGNILQGDEHGVQDISRAVNLHQRAVKQHESRLSMELLGDILRADEHGVQDISLAINLHQCAVKQHQNEFSMASLGYILEREEHGVQDISRAINMHQRAVEQHQTLVSMERLGRILEEDEHGVQDISRAANLYQRAVKQHESLFSMERLGEILEEDEHGFQDISRAINLHQRAVEQHQSPFSMERLVEIFERDEHGVQDVPRAINMQSAFLRLVESVLMGMGL